MERATLGLAAALAICAALAGGAQAVAVSEFTAGIGSSAELGKIAAGPDGNVWFTDDGCGVSSSAPCQIGRITPSGEVADSSSGLGPGSEPGDITPGPDSNMWFTDEGCASGSGAICAIGRITPSGSILEYPDGPSSSTFPRAITRGSDGNLWYTDSSCGDFGGTCAIGRTTTGGVSTEFTTGLAADSVPGAIAAGPDGNVWFTDESCFGMGPPGRTCKIGQITPSGHITEFSLDSGEYPAAIAPGPDGNVWFVGQTSSSPGAEVGRITPSGTITRFPITGNPGGITAGSDGNLWFTDQATPAIGRITPSGSITTFPAPSGSLPQAITSGPDGNLWFIDHGTTPAIGNVALQLAPSVTTGGPGATSSSSAAVTGTVNPVGGAVSAISVTYTVPGQPARTVTASPAALPAGGQPVAVTAILGGLPPLTTVAYEVVATNAFGTTTGQQRIVTTQPTTPVITAVHQSRKRWREGSRHATIAAHRRRVGTKFSFTLNEGANVELAFTHRVGHKHKRVRTAGRLAFSTPAGPNTITFDGRLKGHKRLAPGKYTLVLTAQGYGHTSTPHKVRFTIVAR